MSQAGHDRRYIRAVESAWSKLLGRPAVISPREFEAIEGWRRRGVPLSIVLEIIGAAGKRRVAHPPKALTSLSRAVDEAWSVVAAGRTAELAPAKAPARSPAVDAWEIVLRDSTAGEAIHELLATLLAELASGTPADELDKRLDSALPGVLAERTLASAREETWRALDPFRSRMSPDEFQATMARALADRLRAVCRLPRLALPR